MSPMRLFQKLRDLEAKATTEKTPGPLTHEECKVILELLKGIPKLLQAIDVMQEALLEYKKDSYDENHQCLIYIADVALQRVKEIANT